MFDSPISKSRQILNGRNKFVTINEYNFYHIDQCFINDGWEEQAALLPRTRSWSTPKKCNNKPTWGENGCKIRMKIRTDTDHKNEHEKFKPKVSELWHPWGRSKRKEREKRSRWEKKGIAFLMKIPVKNGHPEFKSFLTSIAKLWHFVFVAKETRWFWSSINFKYVFNTCKGDTLW